MKILIVSYLFLGSSFLIAEEASVMSKQPGEWLLRITKDDASERENVYIVDTVATERFGTEFVIRKNKYGSTVLGADNIYVGSLSNKERDMVWREFKKDLDSFKFVEPTLRNFGRSFVSAELRVGASSIKITFSSLANFKEIPVGLQKILQMAERRMEASKPR